MEQTWQLLIDDLRSVRSGDFRNDVDRQERLIEVMAFTMQTMLEKLRDASDER